MQKKLPSIYQEVEYLQSTGVQSIDTGFKPNNNTKTEIVFQGAGLTNWRNIFGAMGGTSQSSNKFYFLGCWSSTNGAYCWFGSSRKSNFTMNWTTKYTMILDGPNHYFSLNGITYSHSANTFQSEYNMCLFTASNYDGLISPGAAIKCWSCKIWDNGTLIRDYIPCYRKSDNIAGMYDTVNDVFYTNAGTVSEEPLVDFIVGPNVYYYPEDYQEVEYLESSGTQYIKTQTKWSNTNKLVFTWSSSSTTQKDVVISAFISNTQGAGGLWMGYSSTSYMTSASFVNITFSPNVTSSQKTSKNTVIATYENPSSDYFIGFGRYLAYSGFDIGRKYYKIIAYNDDTEVMNLVPCYRKYDSVAGMYDTVNDVFYTNLATSGTDFIVGPDVLRAIKTKQTLFYNPTPRLPVAYQEVEYLKSDGNSYIDINYAMQKTDTPTVEIDFRTDGNGCFLYGHCHSMVAAGYWFTGIQVTFYFGLFSDNQKFAIAYQPNTRHIVSHQMLGKLYIDGELKKDATGTTVPTYNGSKFYLFACYDEYTSGPYQLSSSYSIYSFKLKNNSGTLIRNMVPCYRKSDSEPGMYDLVNNVFYENIGSGSFTVGSDVNDVIKTKKSIFVGSALPMAYQEVEYISTNTSTNNKIEVPFTAGNSIIAMRVICKATNLTNGYRYNIVTEEGMLNKTGYGFGIGFYKNKWATIIAGKTYGISSTAWDTQKRDLTMTLTLTQLNLTGDITNTLTDSTAFGTSAAWRTRNDTRMSIVSTGFNTYRCQLYKDSVLIHDLIPCYRKSDNIAGMYDIVTNEFYTSTAHDFVVGPDTMSHYNTYVSIEDIFMV